MANSNHSQQSHFLEDLTWPEVDARFAEDPLILIPVGAFAKAHGPHLPLNTDATVARALARLTAERTAAQLADRLPVLIAPVVGFGYYPAFTDYPGSQHLSAGLFQALMAEVIEGFIVQGLGRIALINTGVSTEGPLAQVARDIWDTHAIRVYRADIARLGRSADHVLEQKLGGHADERETSVMLALKAAAVHLERAEADYGNRLEQDNAVFRSPVILNDDPQNPDFSKTGALGDPTLATAEKGRVVLEAMVTDLVDGLRQTFG